MAARAGAAVLADRAHAYGRVRKKSHTVDLVTEADIASGIAVVETVAAHREDARFVVEEDEVFERSTVARGELDNEEVWVIDPLDGTTSFVHGYPYYSVSVALLRDGVPVVGVVHDVCRDETFEAVHGGGATVAGAAIRVAHARSLDSALVATGFPYDRGSTLERQLVLLRRIIKEAHDIRRDGSAALDCCYVACGRVDAFWELALRPWDTSAGALIAQEAGALVTDLAGAPWTPATQDVLVANPALHSVMLSALAE